MAEEYRKTRNYISKNPWEGTEMKRISKTVAAAFAFATFAGAAVLLGAGKADSHEKMLLKPKAEFCYMCHADKKAVYMKSGHGKFDVTCDMCHNSHGSGNKSMLLKPGQDMCYACHSDVKDHFNKSEHGAAGITCNMCHDPHGTPDAEPAKQAPPAKK